MATNVEDLVNQALRGTSYKKRIGNIWEGSEASKTALELYGQARDELLRSRVWPFARRANFSLQLLKGPPPPGGYNPSQPWSNLFAPPGWLYEYAYPGDCLEIRAIVPPPGLWPILDPQPAVFSILNDGTLAINEEKQVILLNTGEPLLGNDGNPILLNSQTVPNANPSGLKVVLTNIPNALSTYTAQAVDPTTWEPLFTMTLVTSLTKKFAIALGRDQNLMKAEGEEIGPDVAIADRHRG